MADDVGSENGKEQKKESNKNEYLSFLIELVIVVGLTFLFIRFVAFRSVVRGSSMLTTLNDRDNLIVQKISYYFHDPERFDIIVFRPAVRQDGKEYFIKRVIGLPGETLEIKDGLVYIDGERLEEDVYGHEVMYDRDGTLLDFGPVEVPEGEVFVLGDNRNNSKDSRYPDVGTVTKKQISGKVFVRFWPLNAWRHF